MSTANDQITRALRLLGVLAEGEPPSADMASDALLSLNQMLDSWSLERLMCYASIEQVYTWPAGERTRTLGPSGDFTGQRPILVDPSTYYVYTGLSYSLNLINQAQYNSIGLKTVSSPLPEYLFVNTSYENVELVLLPVPNVDLEIHVVSVLPVNRVDDPSIELFFPPGYLRAFAYNLAVEIAPEYGLEPSRTVQRIASTSKRNIKRINNPEDTLSIPSALLPTPGGFNFYTGQPC